MHFGMCGPQAQGLGSCVSLGQLQHGCASSASALCGGMKLRRLARMEGTYPTLVQHHCFVCSFWCSNRTPYRRLILCCRLQGLNQCGSWVVGCYEVNTIPITGKPCYTSLKLVLLSCGYCDIVKTRHGFKCLALVLMATFWKRDCL